MKWVGVLMTSSMKNWYAAIVIKASSILGIIRKGTAYGQYHKPFVQIYSTDRFGILLTVLTGLSKKQ